MIELVPDSWALAAPSDEQVRFACERTLEALGDDTAFPAAERLARYYHERGNYAGLSFVEIGPGDAYAIRPDDLHAVSLLGGPKYPPRVDPGATRRLLGAEGVGSAVREVTAALGDIDPAAKIEDAGVDTLLAMEVLYLAVKRALSDPERANPNPWVVTSKLCARKRPGLFPVRDNEVCEELGLFRRTSPRLQGSYQRDFLIYRELLADHEVFIAVGHLADRVRQRGRRPDQDRLRVLDAALWTSVMIRTPVEQESE